MDVERVVVRRAERDDLLDQVRLAMRQHFREYAATAVADKRDARPGAMLQVLEGVEEWPQHDLRIHDVEGHAGQLRAVTDAAQPPEWRAQGPVAREEAGDEDDRAPQPARHIDAPIDGVADEAEVFEIDAALEPHRRDLVPAAHVAEVGQD